MLFHRDDGTVDFKIEFASALAKKRKQYQNFFLAFDSCSAFDIVYHGTEWGTIRFLIKEDLFDGFLPSSNEKTKGILCKIVACDIAEGSHANEDRSERFLVVAGTVCIYSASSFFYWPSADGLCCVCVLYTLASLVATSCWNRFDALAA